MIEARILREFRAALALLVMALSLLAAPGLRAQEPRFGDENIAVSLFADGAPQAGEEWMLALQFRPSGPEWHGYYANPGDAGQGMDLTLDLPDGWTMGEPIYPVPERLVIAGLMNHIYEGEYTVLVPVRVGADASALGRAPLSGFVTYLACTDRICVPQDARLEARQGGDFARWRAEVAPLLDREGGFEVIGETLRIAIPLPADLALGDPHVFLREDDLGGGARVDYAAPQRFLRKGNLLVAEIPLAGDGSGEGGIASLSGIIGFGDGQGLRFEAAPQAIPLDGAVPLPSDAALPSLWLLLAAAFAGGLLLNIMPCVFPILSLKALALARAGGDETAARRDALAYTAGVVLACAGLGALVMALRAAGQQVGWAFQLQEPGVVLALFALTAAITANFSGLFELPGFAISGQGSSTGGSFATGLLAALVATPCTGPFMALALGAALVLAPMEGMAIFAALGLGLALPFLVIGFVPAIRRLLPRPGPWLERFRRWMALPMGLTVAALGWLVWRLGGWPFLALAVLVAILVVAGAIVLLGRRSRFGWAALAAALVLGWWSASQPVAREVTASESLLDPQPFSQAALAEARASGRPVFVWFTADWCVTCKVNESVAIEREATRAAFEKAGVVSLRGDWTRRDEAIASFLADQGAAGVPLYLWYPPGSEARQLPQVLTPEALPALARAAPPAP
ncbi:hypothetical protein GCM10022600_23690 [Qipengyuania pelagi]